MSRRKRGRITVQSQPTKETRRYQRLASIPFLIISIFFVVIGVTVVIPSAGIFGIVWTLIAVCFVVIGIANMVRKNGLAHRVGYDVETDVEGETIVGLMDDVDRMIQEEGSSSSIEERMKQLRSLYDQGLINYDEYEEKRKELLKEL